MAFDFNTLESPILKILSAPNTDLTTISAKSVRRQLNKENPSITPEFLRDNKKEVDAVIGRVFESVNKQAGGGNHDVEEVEVPARSVSRKRKQDAYGEFGEEEIDDAGVEEAPLPKKAKKKASKNELSDAELARQISDEINGRARRTSSKPTKARAGTNGTAKKSGRTKKSAETVDSGDDSDDNGERKRDKTKKKSSGGGGGGAKGGFAKEYILSEALAAVLKVDKLSRPQVVKQLWVHIKDNELQNPSNRREIMCDTGLRAVFGVDKIDMFKMNKVLGQHLREDDVEA